MEKVPNDIILNIISRLPHQTVIYCKLVCKPWRDLLSNTNAGLLFMFGGGNPVYKGKLYYGGEQYSNNINIHEKELYSYKTLSEMDNVYPFDDELKHFLTSDMVGSCNGLVCFKLKDHLSCVRDPIYICKPVTREYVYLPNIFRYGYHYTLVCGFGYCYSTDEYKVVRIFHRPAGIRDKDTSKVQVYTLGGGQGWRDKKSIDYCLYLSPGVCANGAIYWSGFGKLVAFDLGEEEFRFIPLPPPLVNALDSISLRLLRGYLSAMNVTREGERKIAHIWVLRKKKQGTNSAMEEPVFEDLWCWNEEFSFSWEDPCIGGYVYLPFAVTKSNQILLWFNGSLFYYDPQTTTLTKLWGEDWMFSNVAIPHLNSLVSLEALGEKSKRRI